MFKTNNIKIDLKRAENIFREMQQERDEKYSHVSDGDLLQAVYEGALAYEKKKMEREKEFI